MIVNARTTGGSSGDPVNFNKGEFCECLRTIRYEILEVWRVWGPLTAVLQCNLYVDVRVCVPTLYINQLRVLTQIFGETVASQMLQFYKPTPNFNQLIMTKMKNQLAPKRLSSSCFRCERRTQFTFLCIFSVFPSVLQLFLSRNNACLPS